ncbi:hypothetical protein [Paenibacillus sp. BJ-4]|uniref:hypothetical protein n=1 Tax=Paenibacillus sp. BJ-4 TaxID=2878097 RepID=UPI001CF08CAC|nr:hypothetical protein [Paenibacillus sp. BJ-4]
MYKPLGEDQLLLVGARCSYYCPDQYDLNGRIVDRNCGATIRNILLGDAIQNVQTTASGVFGQGISMKEYSAIMVGGRLSANLAWLLLAVTERSCIPIRRRKLLIAMRLM